MIRSIQDERIPKQVTKSSELTKVAHTETRHGVYVLLLGDVEDFYLTFRSTDRADYVMTGDSDDATRLYGELTEGSRLDVKVHDKDEWQQFEMLALQEQTTS